LSSISLLRRRLTPASSKRILKRFLTLRLFSNLGFNSKAWDFSLRYIRVLSLFFGFLLFLKRMPWTYLLHFTFLLLCMRSRMDWLRSSQACAWLEDKMGFSVRTPHFFFLFLLWFYGLHFTFHSRPTGSKKKSIHPFYYQWTIWFSKIDPRKNKPLARLFFLPQRETPWS